MHDEDDNDGQQLTDNNRRELLTSSVKTMAAAAAAAAVTATTATTSPAFAEEDNVKTLKSTSDDAGITSGGVIMYKTSSGLKYIELEKGKEESPALRYGQLVVVSYTAYMKLPNSKEKEKFDSCSGYVLKHGNGRLIPGFEEGLHTMKMGGLRRIIIPPKLGFIRSGLGPMPVYPWDRRKLNNLLDEMVTQRGGNLVYDVRLENYFDDEADQGYYDDAELSKEELEELERRLLKREPLSPSEPEEGVGGIV